MYSTVLFISFLVLSIQGDPVLGGPLETLQDDLKKQESLVIEVKDWGLETVNSLKNEVESKVNEVENLHTTLMEQSKTEIENKYNVNKNQLKSMNLSSECKNLGEAKLKEFQDSNFKKFLLCPNLTLAAEDVVAIGFEATKLTAGLLMTADDLMHGFKRCLSWNPLKLLSCSYKWVTVSVYDSFKNIRDIRKFTVKVANYILDIKNEYDYCTKESEKLADVHTFNVMTEVHRCSTK